MKRSGVRTRTLGTAWEERFLAAVQKAREQKLIAPDAAEKLRRLAGVYLCAKCKKEHRTESALGRAHLRLQPIAPPAETPKPKGKARRQAPLPVELVGKAKDAGARDVDIQPRGPRTARRVRKAAEAAVAAAKQAPAPKKKRKVR